MPNPRINDMTPAYFKGFLRLNDEFVHWTAPMDSKELKFVLSHADYARQIDGGAGMLIGYSHDTAYPDHKNLEWLRQRLTKFFYIDRIIINAAHQSAGLGQLLYQDVANFARARGHSHLACEVNTEPDNPASHRFHLRFGFEPIGEQDFPDYGKSVRYYAAAL